MRGKPTKRFSDIGATESTTDPKVVLGRAVVIGGSVAGLLAARVLSDHAEEVVVIERDDAGTNEPRLGVPQGTQLHALLDGGRRQLDRWFPGFSAELLAGGAVASSERSLQMYVNGALKVTVPGDELIGTSRPFLESKVRQRTLQCANIRETRGQVRGLEFDGGRVSGVRYAPADAVTATEVETADLVVDASGRSSRIGDWLEQAGWPSPPLIRMGIDLNYATAAFVRDGRLPEVSTVQSVTVPGNGRTPGAAVMTAVEGGRWAMMLAGFADDRPSRDPAEYLHRCRELPPPFAQVAENCEPVGPIVTYRQADSRRRNFHRAPRFPAGLVAVGDAVASFNPVYGQGMSSAALHASCLSAYLRSGASLKDPATGYFDDVRVVVDAVWQLSTLNDLALPHVTGPYPLGYGIARRLSGLILEASITDVELNRRFLQVAQLRAHPGTLMGPGTLLRATRARRRARADGLPSRTEATLPTS